MAAIYRKHNLVVMQMPKTACIWRIHALFAAGLGRPERIDLGPDHDNRHAALSQLPNEFDGYTKIGFVRRPDHWLRSWWMMRMQRRNWHSTWPTWMTDVNLDTDCRSEQYETFIDKYLAQYPGFFGRLTEDYIGKKAHRIDHICRFENLADDLCVALETANIKYNEDALRSVKQRNSGRKRWRDAAKLPQTTVQQILQSESLVTEEFYPELLTTR